MLCAPPLAVRLNSGVRPWVLGTVVAGFSANRVIALIRSVRTSHARERHRWSLVTHLGFGQAVPRRKYDHPESASGGLAVRVLGRAPGSLASAAASSSSSPSRPARLVVVFGQGLGRGSSGGVPGSGGLTSHSSRCRFAARLNSGVRRYQQGATWILQQLLVLPHSDSSGHSSSSSLPFCGSLFRSLSLASSHCLENSLRSNVKRRLSSWRLARTLFPSESRA